MELAEKAAGAARENLAALEKFDPKAAAADQDKAIQEMRDRFGKNQPQLDELQRAQAALIAERVGLTDDGASPDFLLLLRLLPGLSTASTRIYQAASGYRR